MTHTTTLFIATITLFLVACGSLEKKSALIGIGDDKEQVLKVLGPPADREATRRGSTVRRLGRVSAITTTESFGFTMTKLLALLHTKALGKEHRACRIFAQLDGKKPQTQQLKFGIGNRRGLWVDPQPVQESGRGRGTRHAQGVGEHSGGLRVRVPSSQDTHRYESSEYQTCRNE